MIIELSNLYVGSQVVGCNWNVLQIKKYDTLSLDQCMIIDDEEVAHLTGNVPLAPCIPMAPPIPSSLSNLIKPNNKKYEKYFKMLKMGIPLPAVKNNMIRDGNEFSFVEGLPNDVNQFKAKLNSLPSEEKSSGGGFVPSTSSLLDMKSLLKKSKTNEHEKKETKNDGFAPSLSDIRNILGRLKKPGQLKIKKMNEVSSKVNLK